MRLLLSAIFLLGLFCLPIKLEAQDKAPNIAYVYPAGAQRGKLTKKIFIGGGHFEGAKEVLISGSGVRAKIVNVITPPDESILVRTRNQFEKKFIESNADIREELERDRDSARKKISKVLSTDKDYLNLVRSASERYYLYYTSTPSMAQTVEIEIDISEDAEVGERDLRVLTPAGLSNSVKFRVDNLPEVSKPSLRQTALERVNLPNIWSGARIITWRNLLFVEPSARQYIDAGKLPAILNGQIVEKKSDFWKFRASAGQRIVACLWAQALHPFISDAVPGWFQPTLLVRDSDGKEIAYNDDFEHRPDSLLVFDIPRDGVYSLEVRDAISRSREDFVYRLLLGEVPFVKSVFPLGFNSSNEITPKNSTIRKAKFYLNGINLNKKQEILSYSNLGDFAFKTSNVFHKNIPLDGRGKATLSLAEIRRGFGKSDEVVEKLKLPALVDGRIVRARTADRYSFYAREGEKVIAEIFARRLDSPLDSSLELRDASGKIVATSDDYEDLSFPMVTHHSDSRLEFTPSESGHFTLRVSDSRGEGSPSHSYRLYVGKPIPDFSLKIEPATINVRPNQIAVARVEVFRKNGMNAAIKLRVKNLPKDFEVFGDTIEAGKTYTNLMLMCPKSAKSEILKIEVEGEASFAGEKHLRLATPSQNMMQAFYYWHLVPSSENLLSVNAPSGFARKFAKLRPSVENISKPVRIALDAGGDLAVATGVRGTGDLKVEFFEAPSFLKIKNIYTRNGVLFVKIECDKTKCKLGDKGEFSLLFKARVRREFLDFNAMPSLPFEISTLAQREEFLRHQSAWVDKIKSSPKKKSAKRGLQKKPK